MLMNAGKFKDEAWHYACLQAAFAAAVRAGDAVLAANAIEKIAADTKDFGAAEERRLVKKVLEKAAPEKSKGFLRKLEVERAKIVYATPVSDAAAATIAKLKTIVVPSVSFKPPTTLSDQSRAAWRLLSGSGLSVKDAARRLGIPANTVTMCVDSCYDRTAHDVSRFVYAHTGHKPQACCGCASCRARNGTRACYGFG